VIGDYSEGFVSIPVPAGTCPQHAPIVEQWEKVLFKRQAVIQRILAKNTNAATPGAGRQDLISQRQGTGLESLSPNKIRESADSSSESARSPEIRFTSFPLELRCRLEARMARAGGWAVGGGFWSEGYPVICRLSWLARLRGRADLAAWLAGGRGLPAIRGRGPRLSLLGRSQQQQCGAKTSGPSRTNQKVEFDGQ